MSYWYPWRRGRQSGRRLELADIWMMRRNVFAHYCGRPLYITVTRLNVNIYSWPRLTLDADLLLRIDFEAYPRYREIYQEQLGWDLHLLAELLDQHLPDGDSS